MTDEQQRAWDEAAIEVMLNPPQQQPIREETFQAAFDANERVGDRPIRVNVTTSKNSDGSFTQSAAPGFPEKYRAISVADAFGTNSQAFVDQMLGDLLTFYRPTSTDAATRGINAALAVLDGQKPADEIEAMLITQMIATHEMAMRSLGETLHGSGLNVDSFANISTKMLRTFSGQVEALAKLRRKGEQTVKVVHVYPGGQAVVGDVHHHKGGEGATKQNEALPHDQASDAPIKALRSPDPLGNGVPLSSDAERPMQTTRRAKPRRSRGE
jgi:hypothetical protein